MGEAILAKFGGGQSGGGYTQKTVIIKTDQTWTVPKSKGQQFMVRIFGAGGGVSRAGSGGAGGGNMNNAMLKLNIGEQVQVSIGKRMTYDANGGTTSFGTYLSATGGEKPNGKNGGNGGTGGGGVNGGRGGHGTYGGGGGGYIGGNGGIYGGGGGGYTNGGISLGGYGKGGTYNTSGQNGLNTLNKASELDFAGTGLAPQNNNGSGGGGYGGCGGFAGGGLSYSSGYGGGGGYGGNGGKSHAGSGGGGGYGGDGRGGSNGDTYSGGGGGGYGPEGYGEGAGGLFFSYPVNGSYPTLNGSHYGVNTGICIITYMEPVQ